MNDRELITMAAFRMREASKRLRLLAHHAGSPALMLWLTNSAEQLEEQAQHASAIVVAAQESDDVPRRAVA
jgi:hypothetical protein